MTILATHYRLPTTRLVEFLYWNNRTFRDAGARVVIVSNDYYPSLGKLFRLPIVVYQFPYELDPFSLTRCSNFGLRKIGQGIIVKTDIDCFFPSDTLAEIAAVKPGESLYYKYHMAKTIYDIGTAKLWTAGSGTVAMHWEDWDSVGGYDQRLEGYCSDDADIVARAPCPRQGSGRVYHIDPPGARFWNRETINPLNRKHCAEVRAAGKYQRSEDWGMF